MKKYSVCVIFDGAATASDKALRSAEYILRVLDPEKYNVFPVGITDDGDWLLFGGDDYSQISGGQWRLHPANRRATISPVRDQGLLSFEGDNVVREWIDVAFPVPGLQSSRYGALQGLLELAGIPYVGATAASALVADRILVKLAGSQLGWRQVPWTTVRKSALENRPEDVMDSLEKTFPYPMVVRSAQTNGPVNFCRVDDRVALKDALLKAAVGDRRVLVERYLDGYQLRVAVVGNDNPMASECGLVDTEEAPEQVSEELREQARETAVGIYTAMGCRGMACVSFVQDCESGEMLLSDLDPFPEFSEDSFFTQLFSGSGFRADALAGELVKLAMEDAK